MLHTSQNSPPKFFFQSVAKNIQRGDPSKYWIRAESAPPQSTTSFQSPARIGLKKATEFHLEPKLPRFKQKPARYRNDGDSESNAPETPKEYYSTIYFKVLDSCIDFLEKRFKHGSDTGVYLPG